MKKSTKEEKARKIIIITCIIFVLLLIPLYVMGQYAHPSVDDYYYGTETVKVWNTTHSFWETCKKSAEQTKEVYQNWQGNFSGIFLMGLQPGIFGENNYIWTTVIILTTFVVANIFFYRQLMMKLLKADKKIIFFISMIITMAALQYTYMPVDSFYWYNGSIYYTFFYSLSLILFGTILWQWDKKGIKTYCVSLITIILSFFIGGSNYSTALISVIILFLVNGYDIISYAKQKTDEDFFQQERRHRLIRIIENSMIFLSLASGFMISVLAPGNAIRQAAVGGSSSVIKALILSFCYAGYNIASATTLPVLCIWFLLLPLLWKVIPEPERLELGQKKRIRMICGKLLFLFGLFAVQGIPVFYAQGIRIPYRMMNIIYFSYFTFALLVWIFLLKEIKQSGMIKQLINKYKRMEEAKRTYHKRLYYGVCSLLLCVAIIGNIKIQESEEEKGKVRIEGLPITAQAVYSFITGEAKSYSEEVNQRVQLYENEKIKKLRVKAFENHPYLLYHSDITKDKKNWRNQHVSKYYNKKYVVLMSEE